MGIKVHNSRIDADGSGYVQLHVTDIDGDHYESWYFDRSGNWMNRYADIADDKKLRKLSKERNRLIGGRGRER